MRRMPGWMVAGIATLLTDAPQATRNFEPMASARVEDPKRQDRRRAKRKADREARKKNRGNR